MVYHHLFGCVPLLNCFAGVGGEGGDGEEEEEVDEEPHLHDQKENLENMCYLPPGSAHPKEPFCIEGDL